MWAGGTSGWLWGGSVATLEPEARTHVGRFGAGAFLAKRAWERGDSGATVCGVVSAVRGMS